MIDEQKLMQLKEDVRFNDRCMYVESMLHDYQNYADWDSLIETFNDPYAFNLLYLNKIEEEGEFVSSVQLQTQKGLQRKEIVPSEIQKEKEEEWDEMPCVIPQELLEKQRTFIVTNWEEYKPECINLIHQLMDVFRVEFDNAGVWPAQISSHSGHAHLYAGLKGSNSFGPHVDIPTNFIFQIEGETEVTLYKNRACQMLDPQTESYWPAEKRKALWDTFEEEMTVVMKPGDMVYVPTRTYHHFKPQTDRISISFPLIYRSPFEGML